MDKLCLLGVKEERQFKKWEDKSLWALRQEGDDSYRTEGVGQRPKSFGASGWWAGRGDHSSLSCSTRKLESNSESHQGTLKGSKKRNFFFKFIYLAALVPGCCIGFSLLVVRGGYSSVVGWGVLTAVASLVAEHGLQGVWAPLPEDPGLESTGSVVVAHGLSCSTAVGSSWTRDRIHSSSLAGKFLPLSHQGSPKEREFLNEIFIIKTLFW